MRKRPPNVCFVFMSTRGILYKLYIKAMSRRAFSMVSKSSSVLKTKIKDRLKSFDRGTWPDVVMCETEARFESSR